MEGSESEAIFESFDLNPQRFINEVFITVDDLVEQAFTFFNQEASTILKIDVTEGSDDLNKGVGCIRNMIQSSVNGRLKMWEKYCLRHCFSVPEGFSLPKFNEPSGDTTLDLEALGDLELDAQLHSLRDKLTLVGKKSAELKKEIQTLERHSASINHSAASIDEALELYEKHSMHDMLQELNKSASEFRAKVEKLNRSDEIEHGRAEKRRMLNGDIFKANYGLGLFKAKLEELQELSGDIKTY